MICLFIDTTFKDVSIALVEDNTILVSINKSIPNEHSIYTVSFIDDVLKEAKKTPDMVDRILVVLVHLQELGLGLRLLKLMLIC